MESSGDMQEDQTSKERMISRNPDYDGLKETFYQVLINVRIAIVTKDVVAFKKELSVIEDLYSKENRNILMELYQQNDCPVANSEWHILACKYNVPEILKLILQDDSIFNTLRKDKLTSLCDEKKTNAFYYAIKSNSIDLLDILTNFWLENSKSGAKILEDALSRDFEEVTLKMLPVSFEMIYFVINKLVTFRMSKSMQKKKKGSMVLCSLEERIDLVREISDGLSFCDKVNPVFLYKLTFIAKHIHMLKREMKSTFSLLPWNEIEFCTVMFVKTYMKHDINHLLFKCILNKKKVVGYIQSFAILLHKEKANLSVISNKLNSKQRRKEVMDNIKRNVPELQSLYEDFALVRDVNSLEVILECMDQALSADTSQYYDRLAILRCLQLIGEYLKDTLESPNLSEDIVKRLYSAAPHDTREILKSLRNTLAHSHALVKLTELQKSTNKEFFDKLLNEVAVIRNVLLGIIYQRKTRLLKIVLQAIVGNDDIIEIKYMRNIINSIGKTSFVDEIKFLSMTSMEFHLRQIENCVGIKSKEVAKTFHGIEQILLFEKQKLIKSHKDFLDFVYSIKTHSNIFEILPDSSITKYKDLCSKVIKDISESENASSGINKNLFPLINRLLQLFKSEYSIQGRALNKALNHLYNVLLLLNMANAKNAFWLSAFHDRIESGGKNMKKKLSKQEYEDILQGKVKDAEILVKEIVKDVNKISCKRKSALELIMLDVLSILGENRKVLEDNLMELDVALPCLLGKNLRNHLAHDNELQRILPTYPLSATISAAQNLNKLQNGYDITKMNISEIRSNLKRSLDILTLQERMIQSLEDGNLCDFEGSVKDGADPLFNDGDMHTGLHIASKGPCLNIIKLLIDSGLKIDDRDVKGQTALHIAAAFERNSIVDYLIKREIDINAFDRDGRTPIHLAAKNGYTSVVETLLANNARTDLMDVLGFCPIHYAVINNHIKTMEVLINYDKSTLSRCTKSGDSLLSVAVKGEHLEAVEMLLGYNIDINVKNKLDETPIINAASHNLIAMTKMLFERGADIDCEVSDGRRILHFAMNNECEEIIKYLIGIGARVNYADRIFNCTPLHYAVNQGYLEVVRILINAGSDIDACTSDLATPLILAAADNHEEIAQLLITQGASIDPIDVHKSSALHKCSYKGNKRIVRLLLDRGADVQKRNKNGHNVLFCAILSKSAQVCRMFIEHGVDVNSSDFEGYTALHLSISLGSLEIVQLLMESGANVNATNVKLHTPLHIASTTSEFLDMSESIKDNLQEELNLEKRFFDVTTYNKASADFNMTEAFRDLKLQVKQNETNHEILKMLLNNGAHVNAVDKIGSTPLHYAAISGNLLAVITLLDNQADIDLQNIYGCSPLHNAIIANNVDIVEVLIQRGADINIINYSGFSPLAVAANINCKEAVILLIEEGADVNLGRAKPLSCAISNGFQKIVRILLERKDIEIDSLCLSQAINLGLLNIVELLLDANLDPNSFDGSATVLQAAITGGHEKIANLLLDRGADIEKTDSKGHTALYYSMLSDNVKFVELLLSRGAKINAESINDRSVFEMSITRSNLEVIGKMLQYFDVNSHGKAGRTALHIAARNGSLDVVKFLIEQGANFQAADDFKFEPLDLAVMFGHKAIVEYYLKNIVELHSVFETLLKCAVIGGNVDLLMYLIDEARVSKIPREFDSNTVGLSISLGQNHLNILKSLIKHCACKCDMDIIWQMKEVSDEYKDIFDMLIKTDILFEAVKIEDSLFIHSLVDAGACVDSLDCNYLSPLHLACIKGNLGIVEDLLNLGADLNIIGAKGKSPLHLASELDFKDIVNILLNQGAAYDVLDEGGKTAHDYAVSEDVENLFDFLNNPK